MPVSGWFSDSCFSNVFSVKGRGMQWFWRQNVRETNSAAKLGESLKKDFIDCSLDNKKMGRNCHLISKSFWDWDRGCFEVYLSSTDDGTEGLVFAGTKATAFANPESWVNLLSTNNPQSSSVTEVSDKTVKVFLMKSWQLRGIGRSPLSKYTFQIRMIISAEGIAPWSS